MLLPQSAIVQSPKPSMPTLKFLLAVVAFVCVAGPRPAVCDVQPGDVITPENATKVRDLVSPGVYYKVVGGMSMKIVPTGRIDWPPPYTEASEKYSAQTRLSPNHRSLQGYVAGQPFPLLDPNDPYIATKIVWNNVFRPIATDDYDLRDWECESQYTGLNAPHRVVDYFEIGHYAGYQLVGRTEVAPLPVDDDFRDSGRYWLFAVYPLLAPQELHGQGFLRFRYADAGRGDDFWTWNKSTRRVRRMSENILSSANLGGTSPETWDPDHWGGFNSKTEEYDYRYLGEKTMLAVAHAEHSPEVTCLTDGGGSACPEAWEKRHLYIVEAIPRRDRIREALHSKTVLYMDSELWFSPYVETYNRADELWQSHIFYLTYRDRPVPDAKVAIYPFKREFLVGSTRTDVLSGLATMCYLPARQTGERESWYINMGAVDRSFFTIDSMVKSAR